jgi:type III secretory pathway component EscS
MSVAPELTLTQPREHSLTLVIAGCLMVAAGLMLANPWVGATDTRWPWQIIAKEWPRRGAVNWTLWFVAALAGIGFGCSRMRRLRAPLSFGFAVALAATCCARDAGLAIDKVNLAWFTGVTLLLAGFLLEAQGGARDAARSLGALGGVLILWTLGSSFTPLADGTLDAHLEILVRDTLTRLGGGTVPDERPEYDIQLWSHAAVIVASTISLLTWVGLRGALVGTCGFLLVLVYLLVPTFDKLGQQFATTGFDTRTVFFTLSEVLIHTGLALAIFVAAAVADLVRLEDADA